jgi:hypothetical protein
MDRDKQVLTAKTVLDFAIAKMNSDKSNDPDRCDILVLRLKVDTEIADFALDRRTAERLSAGLSQIAKKLSAPRHEN